MKPSQTSFCLLLAVAAICVLLVSGSQAQTPWPSSGKRLQTREVHLIENMSLPILRNGAIIGRISCSSGTVMKVVSVSSNAVTVLYRDEQHTIPIASTDLSRSTVNTKNSDSDAMAEVRARLQKKVAREQAVEEKKQRDESLANEREVAELRKAETEEKDAYWMEGKILQVFNNGVLLDGRFLGYANHIRRESKTLEKVFAPSLPGTYFVICQTTAMVDGDPWSGKVYSAGRLQYTSVLGATKTVSQFSVDRPRQ